MHQIRANAGADIPARPAPALRELTTTADLLVLLLVTDVAFIALAVVWRLGWLSDDGFSLAVDRGYPEVFQYIKAFWIALCFGYLAWRVREAVYAVLAVAFFYLLLDDAGQIHETGGRLFAEHLNLHAGFRLRARDYGEMLVSAIAGVALLGPGLVAYHFSGQAARRVARLAIGGVLLLAFFGIAVDMVHMMVNISGVNFALELTEDGGEMMVMSLIAAGALAVVRWYRGVTPAIAPPAP